MNVRLARQFKRQAAKLGGRLSQARHGHFVLAAGNQKPRLIAAMGDRRQVVRVVEHVGRIAISPVSATNVPDDRFIAEREAAPRPASR